MIKIYSHKNLITSIVPYLIHNTIEYHDCLKEKTFTNVSVEDYCNEFKITIEDNKQGIMEEPQGKIFEMFFRDNNEVKESGLGLCIVKSALNKLYAKIKIDSDIKKEASLPSFWVNKDHLTYSKHHFFCYFFVNNV